MNKNPIAPPQLGFFFFFFLLVYSCSPESVFLVFVHISCFFFGSAFEGKALLYSSEYKYHIDVKQRPKTVT